MNRFQTLGIYYFYLDCIARFYQNRDIHLKTKVIITLLGAITLCGVAWHAAEWLTLRIGEYPGSLNYVSIKYQYMMRLFCVESLLVTGTLFATAMAQRSGKIFTEDRA